MGQPKADHLSIAEYLAIEREDDIRYEYHEGEIFAMAGGTIAHSTICSNVAGELYASLKDHQCRAFNSEQKIEIVQQRRYVYPDASVFCSPIVESETTTGAATNPTLVVEVTSESSEGYDRGRKFKYYRQLRSLREYLIIDQTEAAVTLYRWEPASDLFRIIDASGLEGTIELESLGLTLQLADLYRNVEFPPKEEREFTSERHKR